MERLDAILTPWARHKLADRPRDLAKIWRIVHGLTEAQAAELLRIADKRAFSKLGTESQRPGAAAVIAAAVGLKKTKKIETP